VKAFYGSKISPNQTKTPEGFLICHNVPITRVGWLEYLGQELGLKDAYDQIVKVYRSYEEVFNPATMASFESKSVTDGHPSSDVRADNYSSYEKGQVTNVRQGQGNESDLLLADLVIKDPLLISEIDHNGKREVSCGYDCNYIPIPGEEGKYSQVQIRGNHVAVVPSGRAGNRVSIKDESPKIKRYERRKKMPINKKGIFGRMLSAFARDAEPEELAEAAKMGPTEDGIGIDPNVQVVPAKPVVDEPSQQNISISELVKQVQALTAVVGQLLQAEKSEPNHSPDDLESLISELEAPNGQRDNAGEESVTISPEQMTDAEPISSPCDRPNNPIPGADRNVVLNAIKAIKPIIAAIPDAGERKKASDALAKTFRDQIVQSPVKFGNLNGYEAIQSAISANARQTKDSNKPDPAEEGRNWAKKYNPHCKEGGK